MARRSVGGDARPLDEHVGHRLGPEAVGQAVTVARDDLGQPADLRVRARHAHDVGQVTHRLETEGIVLHARLEHESARLLGDAELPEAPGEARPVLLPRHRLARLAVKAVPLHAAGERACRVAAVPRVVLRVPGHREARRAFTARGRGCRAARTSGEAVARLTRP